jgi:hypothetical protein
MGDKGHKITTITTKKQGIRHVVTVTYKKTGNSPRDYSSNVSSKTRCYM